MIKNENSVNSATAAGSTGSSTTKQPRKSRSMAGKSSRRWTAAEMDTLREEYELEDILKTKFLLDDFIALQSSFPTRSVKAIKCKIWRIKKTKSFN